MGNNIKITCLICYYINDDLDKFKKAIGSIFSQIDVNYNVILVIDGPIDDISNSYISSLGDSISVLRIRNNVGHGEARRRGLELCKTKYVAIFDSDDISYNYRLKLSYDYMEKHPSCGVVSGIIKEIWQGGIITFRNCKLLNFKYSSPVNQNCCFIRMESYSQAGGYLDWFHNEDTFLWIRMINSNWNIGTLDIVLADVFMDEFSLKRRRGFKYFLSEIKLRNYMYKCQMITFLELLYNFFIRLFVQLFMPYQLFKYVYLWRRKF